MILNCMTLPTGNYLGARLDISQSSLFETPCLLASDTHVYRQVCFISSSRSECNYFTVSSSRLLFYCIVSMCNFRAIQKMISFLFM